MSNLIGAANFADVADQGEGPDRVSYLVVAEVIAAAERPRHALAASSSRMFALVPRTNAMRECVDLRSARIFDHNAWSR